MPVMHVQFPHTLNSSIYLCVEAVCVGRGGACARAYPAKEAKCLGKLSIFPGNWALSGVSSLSIDDTEVSKSRPCSAAFQDKTISKKGRNEFGFHFSFWQLQQLRVKVTTTVFVVTDIFDRVSASFDPRVHSSDFKVKG